MSAEATACLSLSRPKHTNVATRTHALSTDREKHHFVTACPEGTAPTRVVYVQRRSL